MASAWVSQDERAGASGRVAGALYGSAGAAALSGGLVVAAGIGMLGLRSWSRPLGLVYCFTGMAHGAALMAGVLTSGTFIAWGWSRMGFADLAFPIVLLCFLIPSGRAAVLKLGAAAQAALKPPV